MGFGLRDAYGGGKVMYARGKVNARGGQGVNSTSLVVSEVGSRARENEIITIYEAIRQSSKRVSSSWSDVGVR